MSEIEEVEANLFKSSPFFTTQSATVNADTPTSMYIYMCTYLHIKLKLNFLCIYYACVIT